MSDDEFKPKVSVIIPVYNTGVYLKQCMNSIINQTLKDIEIICVDDESTDNSLAILSQYAEKDKRIKVFSQPHSNAGEARNLALLYATGEYIYFMDSDDWVSTTLLEKIYNFSKINNLDIGIFKYRCYNNPTKSLGSSELGFKYSNKTLVKDNETETQNLFSLTNFAIWNKLYRHTFIKENNIQFDNISSLNDVTFSCVSLIISSKIGFLNDVLYYYRINRNGSITKDKYNSALNFINVSKSLKDNLIGRNLLNINENNYIDAITKVYSHVLRRSKPDLKQQLTNAFNDLIDEIKNKKLKPHENIKDTLDNISIIKPKVTTIITSYNHEKFIEKAILSALNQRGDFIHEIIISDDGSTDNTPNIIKQFAEKYPNLIKNISKATNTGISNNMKSCFENATGDFIAVLEGDDYWIDTHKIEKQSQFLINNKDCSMVFSNILITNAKKNISHTNKNQVNMKDKISESDLCQINGFNCLCNFSCCMFRTELIKKIPNCLYDGRLSEIPLQFLFLRYGLIGHINKIMSIYRQHENGVWSGSNSTEKLKQSLHCLIQVTKICSEKAYEKVINYIKDVKLPIDTLKNMDISIQNELLNILGENEIVLNQLNYNNILNKQIYSDEKSKLISFSIIMPTYNRRSIITKSIDSVLSQSYKHYELLIIDDGSTDDTYELVKIKYKSQLDQGIIKYQYIKENNGVCNARNKGLELASYQWIAYCDSDNTWTKDYLESVYNKILENPSADLFYGKIKSITNGKEIGHRFNYKDLYTHNFIDMNVFVHSYDMYKKYGGFDLNLKRLVDYDLILNYTLHSIPIFIDKVFCNYNNGKHIRISNTESLNESKTYLYNKYPFFRCEFDKTI